MAIMGLLPSPLLVFLVVLLFGSLIATDQNYPVYTFCRPTQSNVVKLSPHNPVIINHEIIDIQRSPLIDIPVSVTCTISLQAGPEPLILTFDFNKLNVKRGFHIGVGSICINGVQVSDKWPTGHTISYILPENRTSTISLIQTTAGQGKHCQILLTPELATRSKKIIETRSVNTNREVVLVEVNYYKDMPYIDFCSVKDDSPVYTLCKKDTPTVVKLTPQSPPFFIRTNYSKFDYHTFNSACWLALEAGNDPLLLTFYFRKFSLEYSYNCDADYLCLHRFNLCGPLMKGSMLHYILPKRRQSTIVYAIDWNIESEGFDILVTTELAESKRDVPEPRAILQPLSQPIYSYEGYNNYPYDDKCGEINIPRVFELCHPLKSHTMRINANSQPFIIQSPYWGKHDYPNGQSCSLDLISDNDPLILSFNYSTFHLEKSTNCDDDYLCVSGVNFCGSWTKLAYENILPRGQTFTISFHTNDVFAHDGFHILVTPRYAYDNNMVTDVIWSHPFKHVLEFKNVTYRPGMFYRNKCSAYRHNLTTTGRPTDLLTTASGRSTTANKLLTNAKELLTIATTLLATFTEQPTAVTKLLTTATELLKNATEVLTTVNGQPTKAAELLPTATRMLNKAKELLIKATKLPTTST